MATNIMKHGSNQNIVGFVPAIVMEYLLEKVKGKEKRKIPDKQTFNSVVMFADISGFTNLAERLSSKGNEGAELLAFTLNRYMELLVKAIGKSGGDIFKFAGDAMIVLWPPPLNNNFQELTTLLRQAIQSALDIQSKLHNTKMVEDVTLSVKIGFGVGQVTILHVGGVFNRVEYLSAGDPLTQAFESEHLATSGGVVIVSRQVWDMVNSHFDFEEIKDSASHSDNGPFYYVKNVKKDQQVKMKADALLIKNRLKPSDIESIKPFLASYIPAATLPYIALDQEKWSSELRRLSVLFVNLGIDLSDAKSEEGLLRIQTVIETVQNVIYMHEGSVNKLLMDDKGSTLIVVFGMPPISHQDDPVRAVLAAISLSKELKKINCQCSIGITTGIVLAGVVGTSGSRREYSVLGDSVNLSARFMQAACYQKEKKILVDEVTKKEAECKICFKFVMKQAVKGKSGEIPFFEPIDPSNPEVSQYPLSLKTHFNTPTIGSMINASSLVMVGSEREKQLHKAVEFSKKCLRQPVKSAALIITGTFGIGKGLFARNLIEQLKESTEALNWKKNEHVHFMIGTLNSKNKMTEFNGWQSIVPSLISSLSSRLKKSKEDLFENIINSTRRIVEMEISETMIFLLKELCNVESMEEAFPNMKTEEKISSFRITKFFIVELLRNFLEEFEDKDSEYVDKTATVPPLVLVFDDFQDFDEISVKTITKAMKKLRKIVFVLLVRNEFWELPLKTHEPGINFLTPNPVQKDIVEEGLSAIEGIVQPNRFMKVSLNNLEKSDLKKLMTSTFKVSHMSNDDPELENSLKQRNRAVTSSTKNSSKSAEELFIQFLFERTHGNPFDIISLTNNLLEENYVYIETSAHILKLEPAFFKCLEFDEFLTLPPPVLKQKLNGPILDHLPCLQYLLLKGASVIGSTFDLQSLRIVNPLKEILSYEKMKVALLELCSSDVLEILDEKEYNITFRFVHEFMRESIYQRLIYSQRRQIHRLVAEAIQSPNSTISINDPELESKKLIFHWCLAENINVFSQKEIESTNAFSNKAKRSIIVKKISSMLSKHTNVTLKTGTLLKKSDKGPKWSTRFCLINTKDFRYYYSEEDYKANPDFSLGMITLKHVFSIQPLDQKVTKRANSFVIYTGGWQKKSKDMGIRQFYFATLTEEDLDNWTTYLEFLRAKAVYDDFVNTFGKISFPLKPTAEKQESSAIELNRFSSNKRMVSDIFSKTNIPSKLINSSFSQKRNSERPQTLILDVNGGKQSRFLSTSNSESNKNMVMKFLMASKAVFFSHAIEALKEIPSNERNLRKIGQNTTFLSENPSIGSSLKPFLLEKSISNTVENTSSKRNDDSPKKSKMLIALQKIEEFEEKKEEIPSLRKTQNQSLGLNNQVGMETVIRVVNESEPRKSTPFNDYPKPKFLANSEVKPKPKGNKIEQEDEGKIMMPVKELISNQSFSSRNWNDDEITKKLIFSPQTSYRKHVGSKKQEFAGFQSSNNYFDQGFPQKKIVDFDSRSFISSIPMKSDNIFDLNKSNISISKSMIQSLPQLGVANKDSKPIDGDEFFIPKGATVTVTRHYEKGGFVECFYDNKIGLFPIEDILLVQDHNNETSQFLASKMKRDLENSFLH